MVSTKTLVIYLMVLVFFNFFAGQFVISQNEDEFNIQKYLLISNVREKIFSDSADNVFTSFAKVVTAPFLLIDAMIFIIVVIGTGVSVLPPSIELLLFTPLGILVIFEYVLPMVRGN